MCFLLIAVLVVFTSCVGQHTTIEYIERVETDSLIIYYPNFSSIDLVCEKEPTEKDSSIIFCCAAAFTHDYVDFSHMNIEGNHVSNGNYYEGNECNVITGGFVFYDDKWDFVYGLADDKLKLAANNGGMGFGQAILIYNRDIKTKTLFSRVLSYRSLCEIDSKVCLVETKFPMSFVNYVEALFSYGIENSIYLDMGGWAYAWYRPNQLKIVKLFEDSHSSYMTNWIIFKR